MNPLTATELHGNWGTLLLPITDDDSIDWHLLEQEIDHLLLAGVDGIYSNGSAGEFYTQTEAEFDQVSALLARKCHAQNRPFQIGACHTSAQIARERIRRTKGLQPSAFQVILPDWFPPSWGEIRTFLATMAAEAAPAPLVLYNPPHAKRQFAPIEWHRLIDATPSIIGIKVAGGGEDWYRAMQPVLQRIAGFIPGHHLATGLARGARGSYSNVACLSPRGAQRWYQLCRDDSATALEWQARIQTFWETHIAPLITRDQLCNMAADKAAAVAGGWLPGLTGRLRWPYRSAEPDTIRQIAAAARRELPSDFFNE